MSQTTSFLPTVVSVLQAATAPALTTPTSPTSLLMEDSWSLLSLFSIANFNKVTKKIFVFCTPILVFIGLILNLLTVMVFCRRRMRKYCLSLTMICLALFDMAILFIPVLLTWIDEIFFQFYFLNNTIWCNLHGYTDLVLCANSSWIIVLISVERWFAVCRPWEKARLFTSQRVGIALFCIFLFSTVFFLYFPFSLTIVTHANSVKECTIKFEKAYNIFGTLSVILVYVMPFILLALLNTMIIVRLRLRPFKVRKMSTKPKKPKKSVTNLNNSFNDAATNGGSIGHDEHSLNENEAAKGSPQRNNAEPSANQTSPGKPKKSKSQTFVSSTNSKTDRNLSITLVTVAITFMILTFPFQMFWFYENLFRWLVESFQQFQANSTVLSPEMNATTATAATFISTMPSWNQTTPVSEASATSSDDADPNINTHFNFQPITFIIKNMNYVINFFLYSALSKLFRQEFVALLSDDKFILINKCVKCLLRKKVARHRNRKGIAELSITLNGLSGNGNDNTKKKCFKIRIENTHLVRFIESFNNNSTNSVSRNEKTITRSVNRNEDEESKLIVEKSVGLSDDGGIYDGGDGGIYDGGASCQSLTPNQASSLTQQSLVPKSPVMSSPTPAPTTTAIVSSTTLSTPTEHKGSSELTESHPASSEKDSEDLEMKQHKDYVAQILATCDESSETNV